MTSKTLAAALALVLGAASGPLMAAVCKPNSAKPFVAGPLSTGLNGNGFPAYLTDSEGFGLDICTDTRYCFFDPPVAGNVFSQQTGFGGEGFWYLADSNTATPELPEVLVVMAAESAYATGVPVDGEQFPFTRLRIRVDVTQTGIYTVTHPYGSKSFVVNAVLDARGRAIRREINDTTDIELHANDSNRGVVGPWLRWDSSLPAPPAGFLGDGPNTLHKVTGSPCGTNHVTVSATALDGVTPLVLDSTKPVGSAARYKVTNDLFTVQGRLAGTTVTPLAIDQAYYSRSGSEVRLNVFASAPTTAALTVRSNLDSADSRMVSEQSGVHFLSYVTATDGTVPGSVQVTAANGTISPPMTLTRAVTDLVTITRADASCPVAGAACTLYVDASSSDQATTPPILTLHYGTNSYELPANGRLTVPNVSVLPAKVTVSSSANGAASKPLIVNNQ